MVSVGTTPRGDDRSPIEEIASSFFCQAFVSLASSQNSFLNRVITPR